MKKLLLSGTAAILLASCGGSGGNAKEAEAALELLSLKESGMGRVDFAEKDVSGSDATFKDVTIRTSELEPVEDDMDMETDDSVDVDMEGADLNIETLSFSGLEVDDAGIALFSTMKMKGLTAVQTDEDATGDLTASDLTLEEPSPELAAWIAGILGAGEVTDMPATEVVSFEGFSLSNLSAVDDEENRFGIGKISVKDYEQLKAGEMSLEDMNLSFIDTDSDAEGSFKLGSIKVDGAKMDFLKALEEDTEEGIVSGVTQIAYGNPIDPGFDDFALEDLSFDLAGVSFLLPSMNYKVDRNSDGVPTKMTMPKFTATFSADAEGGLYGQQVAPMLAAFGYEEVKISGEAESTYDPETDIADSTKNYIEVENAFRLSTTSKVGGVQKLGEVMQNMDAEAFSEGSQDPTSMMMEAYSVLDFYNLSLSLEDQGVVDNAFTLVAAQQGADPAQLRAQVVGMVSALPAIAQGFGIDPAISTELSTALSSFLTQSGTLTITMNPEEPVTLPMLMSDPTAITKQSLGFSAVNDPAETE